MGGESAFVAGAEAGFACVGVVIACAMAGWAEPAEEALGQDSE